jgi:hypothetical protein
MNNWLHPGLQRRFGIETGGLPRIVGLRFCPIAPRRGEERAVAQRMNEMDMIEICDGNRRRLLSAHLNARSVVPARARF